MSRITDAQVETVRGLVAAIPAGSVATYGDIADAARLPSPRIVGWIMRTDSADLPWHRVLRATGRPADHLADTQLVRLREEGVPVMNDRVDLARCRHDFRADTLPEIVLSESVTPRHSDGFGRGGPSLGRRAPD